MTKPTHICQIKPVKPNLSSQIYQTKPPKPSYQTTPMKLILPNQTYQTKLTKPNQNFQRNKSKAPKKIHEQNWQIQTLIKTRQV